MLNFLAGPAARCGALLCLALALASGAAQGAKITERSRQKAAAEAQRAGLQQKLDALKRDIGRTESAKDDAADTLAASEAAISDADRALHDLADEQARTGAKVQQLAVQHATLSATAGAQKKQLAKLLREQYVAGNEDRIKLLLSGDNPNRINRDLQMMAYVSQAQAKLLAALRANLQATEANQQQAQDARDELDEIRQEQQQQKSVLELEKGRRAALLGSLSKRLAAQRQEAGNVARDEQRMSGLVDKLGQLIREQAAAAAAEQRRQDQLAAARAEAAAKAEAKAKAAAEADARLARANKAAADKLALAKVQAERERLARENARPGQVKPAFKPPTPAVPEASHAEPALAAAPPEPKPVEPKPPAALSDAAFASLRGQMRAPVAGKLGARFGSKRGDGPSWKGVFIHAAQGSEVKAVAAGRVVFAEWLRGFGNLIIVDHGGQYMSIYGNNFALLKRAGDAVKGGETIASAGNSGGNEESGLYFELRHQGRAFDPAGWVKF